MQKKVSLLLLLSAFILIACTPKNNKIQIQGKTMGTQYHITVIPPSNSQNPVDQPTLQKEIDAILVEINRQMSTYDPNSEISRFNQYKKTDWFSVSKDFAFVVSTAQAVSQSTNGAFDITVAPLINLWGFDAKVKFTLPSEPQIKNTLKNTGYRLLAFRESPPAIKKLNKNIHINLSAIAKGFAVDKLAEFLEQKGYSNYLVEIGGEVRNQGFNQGLKKSLNKPWQIGIETPEYNNHRHVNKMLLSSNVSLATSGDYRNYFMKDGIHYSHTIDPTTGKPIKHKLASVTVLHKSTMMADAYATALMVMGDKKGKRYANKHKLRVNMIIRDGQKYHVWQTIEKTKIPQSQKRCLKVGGCVYIK